jgi:hypothetical protein
MKKRIIFLLLCDLLLICLGVFSCNNSNNNQQGNVIPSTNQTSGAEPVTGSDATAAIATQPGGLLPKVIGAAEVAGANAELANLMTVANTCFSHNGVFPSTSSELIPSFFKTLKAEYYFDISSGSIIEVDSISGGWPNIVFSLSQQKWVKGTPDNNHSNDQDIP